MKRHMLLTLVLFTGAIVCNPFLKASAGQQSNDSQDMKEVLKELRGLKASVDRMQRDIEEMKGTSPGRPTAPLPAVQVLTNIVLDVQGHMFRGEKKAQLTMIEFSDYQCPFCREFIHDIFPKLEDEYIKAGKLRYYTFSFPLKSHADAALAARAVLCARDQGKFWEMHENLFSAQGAQNLSRDNLVKMAKELGMDDRGFQECLDMGAYAHDVELETADGEKAGIHAIPSFLLGILDPKDDKVQVLRLVNGARPYTQFKEVLDDLLSSAK